MFAALHIVRPKVRRMSDPVQRQLEAYNAKDADAFVACYAGDAVIADPSGTVLVQGAGALRSAYSELFTTYPDLHAEVVSRLQVGAWTVDHERVTRAGETHEALVVYFVADGLIRRVLMLS